MKKIIFCNTSYMKDYCGAANDKPVNGGKYIAEHSDGGETYNFLDYNGICYGSFMHYGNIHVEKIDNNGSKENYVDDVLVIWVAKKENGKNVIVGWYKNARVYKYVKNDFTTSTFGYYPEPDRTLEYEITAKASDCFLLPENKRNFMIPRASTAGTGRGMGQSAIWYADSEYAKKEFVPKVLEYVKNYTETDGKFINKVWTPEMLEKAYQGNDKSEEELIKLAENRETPAEQALEYINKILKSSENEHILCIKADALAELYRFDEAIPYYEKIYEENSNDLKYADSLLYMYMLTQQYDKAIVTAQLIEQNNEFDSFYNEECQAWFYTNTFLCYNYLKKAEKADKYLKKLRELKEKKNETASENLEAIENMLKENNFESPEKFV